MKLSSLTPQHHEESVDLDTVVCKRVIEDTEDQQLGVVRDTNGTDALYKMHEGAGNEPLDVGKTYEINDIMVTYDEDEDSYLLIFRSKTEVL